MNSRFLHDLQETASREDEQVHSIGKQKTRQLSASDSHGIVLSMWALLNCLQNSREMQINGSFFWGFLKHSVSELVGLSDNIQPSPITLQKRRPGPRDREELMGQWPG